jgi:hypothetical protein
LAPRYYPEHNLETLSMIYSLATMGREEHKNLSFQALSSHPPLEHNLPASPGNSSATIMDQGRIPH